MKYFFLLAGILMLLSSSIALGRYMLDYSRLSEYGKGYIWGNIVLFALGLVLVYLWYRKRGK